MYEPRPIYTYTICRWPRSKCVVSEHIIKWKHLYSDDWHWQQCYVLTNSIRLFAMSNEMKSNPPRKGHISNKIDWNKVRNLSLCQMSLLIFAFPICRSSSVSAEKNKLRRIKFTCYLFKIQRMKRKKDDFIGCSFNFLLLPSFLNLISLHRERKREHGFFVRTISFALVVFLFIFHRLWVCSFSLLSSLYGRIRAWKVLYQPKWNKTKWNNAYESWINKLKSQHLQVSQSQQLSICVRIALIWLMWWEPVLSHFVLFYVDICMYFVAVLPLVHVSLFSISIKEYYALWVHFLYTSKLIASQNVKWFSTLNGMLGGKTWTIGLK